jgi:hypothetical protein
LTLSQSLAGIMRARPARDQHGRQFCRLHVTASIAMLSHSVELSQVRINVNQGCIITLWQLNDMGNSHI